MSELTSELSTMGCEEHNIQPKMDGDEVVTTGIPDGSGATFKVPLGPTFGLTLRPRPPLPQAENNTKTFTDQVPIKASLPISSSSDVLKLSQPIVVDETVHSSTVASSDVPYDEPRWSGLPPSNSCYSFEILKGGVIVGSFDLGGRPYVVCGRHSSCDLVMEHPSISRYHTVIQYRRCDGSSVPTDDDDDEGGPDRSDGFYVYDLGSTHGTFLNKNQLKPRRYYRLFIGHMLRFGGSSRTYLMQGPDEECEEESELTVTEIKAMRRLAEQKMALEQARKKQKEDEEKEQEDRGIDWGMGEDAIEEDDDNDPNEENEEVISSINPFALNPATLNEDSYIDDPKKTLRKWFEREGFELEYDIEEKGQAHFLCRIRLPLDHSAYGEPVVIETSVKGKKKEAVAACALEACRTLDRQGLLRQSNKKGQPRLKKRDWMEDDYYDSDEDTFLDRTGTIEKKRQLRIQNSVGNSSINSEIETYETLLTKYAEINEKLLAIEEALSKDGSKSRKADDKTTQDDDIDDLDEYMKTLSGKTTSVQDKTERSRLKLTRQHLHREADRLIRLMKIARPTSLPSLVVAGPSSVPYQRVPKILDGKPTQPEKPPKDVVVNDPDELNTKKKCINLRIATNGSGTQDKPPEVQEEEKRDQPIGAPVDSTDPASLETGVQEMDDDGVPLASSGTGDANDAATESPKKKRHKAIRKSKEARYDYDKSDPNYAMWIPPDDQIGDGRTSLNEKYGY